MKGLHSDFVMDCFEGFVEIVLFRFDVVRDKAILVVKVRIVGF